MRLASGPWRIGVVLLAAACTKSQAASEAAPGGEAAPRVELRADCGHLVCGNNFFIDAAPPAACAPGAPCSVDLTLVATGAFHINDEYPYKFKAEATQGVDFLGSDADGKNVFTKAASDWQKRDEKTGTMRIKLQPASKGDKTISGVFKLSVCTGKVCQLEQQTLTTTVAVR